MFKYLMLLLLSLNFIACKKYKIKDGQKRLPKLTTKGKSIFACYINDQTYKVNYHNKVAYNRSNGYTYIHNETKTFEFRLFVYQGITKIGDFEFSQTGEELLKIPGNDLWSLRQGGLNELTIVKLDTLEGILSGEFNIDLYNEDSTKHIEVREGRFDLELYFVD